MDSKRRKVVIVLEPVEESYGVSVHMFYMDSLKGDFSKAVNFILNSRKNNLHFRLIKNNFGVYNVRWGDINVKYTYTDDSEEAIHIDDLESFEKVEMEDLPNCSVLAYITMFTDS